MAQEYINQCSAVCEYERPQIDWDKTGKNLLMLRSDNLNLRRYVCRYIRVRSEECAGVDCETCRYDIDHFISRSELAQTFGTSEDIIGNWETARTTPQIEDLLLYCKICKLELKDILVFAA